MVPGDDGAVLALDMGASRLRVAVVAPDGTVSGRLDGPTPVEAGPAGVLSTTIEMLRSARDTAPPGSADAIVGVGISAPGPLDPFAGALIDPPNLGPAFRDMPLAAPIAEALGLPVVLDRDTHVAALGELEFGAARGYRNFLYLTVSTGIGGAIVADGQLVTGRDGVAGELGHMMVQIDGPPCGCGARGHLEAVSSGSGIARAAAAAIAAGRAVSLADRQRATDRRLDGREVAAAEEDGDPAATEIMQTARRAFAEACVSLVDIFNPEVIVVGGSLARNQGDRWLDPARERIAAVAFRIHRRDVQLIPAALGDDVGLIGAIPLLRQRAR